MHLQYNVPTGKSPDDNFPAQQSMNGTQNFTTSSSSDIVSHLNLAKQAVEVGEPDTIIKELGLIEQQLLPLVTNKSAPDDNFPAQQSMNGTQNFTTSSSSDIVSHLNLAKQAVEVGEPDTIIKELGLIEQQLLPLVTNNNTSAFSTMSNYSSTDLKELNEKENEPADIEDVPEEQRPPSSSSSQRDPPQRTRGYE